MKKQLEEYGVSFTQLLAIRMVVWWTLTVLLWPYILIFLQPRIDEIEHSMEVRDRKLDQLKEKLNVPRVTPQLGPGPMHGTLSGLRLKT